MTVKYWYREHETGSNPRMRVWQDGWPSDMFEVLQPDQFKQLQARIDSTNALLKEFRLGEPLSLLEWTKED